MKDYLMRFLLIGVSAVCCLWVITLAAASLYVDLTSKQMVMAYAALLIARGFRPDRMVKLDAIDSVIIAACSTIAMWAV